MDGMVMEWNRTIALATLVITAVVVVAMTVPIDADGATGYSARVFTGDGTDSGTDVSEGSGSDVGSILQDALPGLTLSANGTVSSLDGVENSETHSWMIYQWQPPTGWVSVLADASGDAYLEDGTSYYVYYAESSTSSSGGTVYETPSYEPLATAYFFIVFQEDVNANSYVTSVLTEEQRTDGFWISGEGSDVAAAFVDACETLRERGNSGFQLEINSDRTDSLYGYLWTFMGLEDELMSGDYMTGIWKYWSQYCWDDSTSSWEYNNFVLGYFDPGVTPYFCLVRQETEMGSVDAGVDVTPDDIPQEVIDDYCTVTFVNDDGTVLEIQKVDYFGSATAPSDPTKDPSGNTSYEFTGWDTDFDQVISDITVTAQYREVGLSSVTGVRLSPTSLTLTEGGTYRLSATVSPSDAANISVTWTSSNEDVATVDSSGVVTAVRAGTATIKVTTVDGGYEAICTVTVLPPAGSVTEIELDYALYVLPSGGSVALEVEVGPSSVTDRSVTWSSSDDDVATVDQSGLVTAVGPGTATITVTANNGGLSATCVIIVTDGSDSEPILVTVTDDGGSSFSATVNVEEIKNTGTSLEIVTAVGSITLPNEVLTSLSSGSGITVSVSEYEYEDLWEAQQAVIDSLGTDVVLYEYLINGSDVDDLGGTATITMPYTLADGEDADDVRVYCLLPDGGVEAFDCTYEVDEYGEGHVTFQTTHLSIYFATSEDVASSEGGGVAEDDADGDSGDGTLLWAAVIVVVIIVIIAVAAVMIKRRP